MTIEDYWRKELKWAREGVYGEMPDEIAGSLLVARQLRDIVSHLNQIEAQLSLIQQAIEQ